METTETDLHQTPEHDQVLILNAEAQSYLKETAKWASFLSIIGFIFCGFIIIAALFIGTIFTTLSKINPAYSAMPAAAGGIISIVYILFGIIYFFFPFYLYQFANKMKKGLTFSDTAQVTEAMGKLKSFFKYWGILTIILLCFYALIIIVAIVAGIGAAALSR